MRRSGWSASGVATVLIGSPTKSASSPANMRRAERFIHSMPLSPTVTMPTSTESRIARVRSACSSSVSRARWRSSMSTNEQIRPAPSSSSSTSRCATCTQIRLAVAAAQLALAVVAAVLAQRALRDRARNARSCAVVGVQLGQRQAASSAAGIAGQRGHRLVGALDARPRW